MIARSKRREKEKKVEKKRRQKKKSGEEEASSCREKNAKEYAKERSVGELWESKGIYTPYMTHGPTERPTVTLSLIDRLTLS